MRDQNSITVVSGSSETSIYDGYFAQNEKNLHIAPGSGSTVKIHNDLTVICDSDQEVRLYGGDIHGKKTFIGDTDLHDDFSRRLCHAAIFGPGIDGDVTISANTTLTKDMYYKNLTIDSGVTLTTAGYRVFVAETLTNNGTIGNPGGNGGNGSNPTGGSAGAAAAGGTLPAGSSAGGAGGTNSAGGNVAAVTAEGAKSGYGGRGGDPGAYASGTRGSLTLRMLDPHDGIIMYGTTTVGQGAPGGGAGGGAANSGGGGGGGGAGGCLYLAAYNILNSGPITCKGGNGGNGGSPILTGYGGGGGGGGGGGFLVTVYHTYTSAGGTISASGGTGGSGVAGGSNGYLGSTGRSVVFRV